LSDLLRSQAATSENVDISKVKLVIRAGISNQYIRSVITDVSTDVRTAIRSTDSDYVEVLEGVMMIGQHTEKPLPILPTSQCIEGAPFSFLDFSREYKYRTIVRMCKDPKEIAPPGNSGAMDVSMFLSFL
jgi:hypothetical protein